MADGNLIINGDMVDSVDISGVRLTAPSAIAAHRKLDLLMRWKIQMERLQKEAEVFYFAFKHPRVPWYARLLAVGTAGYLFSPIQLIPNFVPVIGFLDDLLVLFLGAKLLLRIIPPDLLTECRELADAAEVRRKEEIRSAAAIIAFVVIAVLWLLAGVGASALIAKYIRH
jgi:uncharacterized membrane protein YkvA (DUF1232 family)